MPLFADGHVVSIHWENIARSIVERSFRDAVKLDVPLCCLQAADQRAAFKSKKQEEQAIHALLTTPNMHKTGKLCGMLLVHVGMRVRWSDVLSPRNGLVKDKLGNVRLCSSTTTTKDAWTVYPPGTASSRLDTWLKEFGCKC